MKIVEHELSSAVQRQSPNFDERPDENIDLIVIHNISLPAGHFGTRFIPQLFCNELEPADHSDFSDLADLRVSSHLLITRDGGVIQFVPFNKRAWHAGESSYQGRMHCNDFSIGIELEGTDESGYTERQYRNLAAICHLLCSFYGIPLEHLAGHSEIAAGRKTDPGPSFDWSVLRQSIFSITAR